MVYRSDWPEIGWPTPHTPPGSLRPIGAPDQEPGWKTISGIWLRTVATQNQFESDLYEIPIWNLHLEILEADGAAPTAAQASRRLQACILQGVAEFLRDAPWHRLAPSGTVYACSKVVPGEPLHGALLQLGFEAVERRRLYLGRIVEIAARQTGSTPKAVWIGSLADLDLRVHDRCRAEILDLCREAFEVGGHSRHFTDPFLLERRPGIEYVSAVMELNFRHIAVERFLLALDASSDQLCGFTVIGQKPGQEAAVYTQLLSAVRKTHRGQGVYRSLTALLSRVLPQDAVLLNVTHVDNLAIQRAYRDSGREHVADTVVLRRVFGSRG